VRATHLPHREDRAHRQEAEEVDESIIVDIGQAHRPMSLAGKQMGDLSSSLALAGPLREYYWEDTLYCKEHAVIVNEVK